MRRGCAGVALIASCWVDSDRRGTRRFPGSAAESQVVAVLERHPAVLAAEAGVQFEEANRARLKAGAYEFTVRADAQNRHVTVAPGSTNYGEYGVAVERPVRLPTKAVLDEKIGAEGVQVASSPRVPHCMTRRAVCSSSGSRGCASMRRSGNGRSRSPCSGSRLTLPQSACAQATRRGWS